MVNTPKNDDLLDDEKRGGNTAFLLHLARAAWPEGRLALAVSGGLDSMALLHVALALAQQQHRHLSVLHVHHGLQEVADDWQVFLADFCKSHQIEFICAHLDATSRKKAQSIEDWARQERYKALAHMAQSHGIDHVWLAQHEDDQIETYCLQKARGAGVRGLSAMPASFFRHGVAFHRPWLTASRARIAQCVTQYQWAHIHDPSNDDLRFARNVVRQRVQQFSPSERAQTLLAVAQAQVQNAQEQAWAQAILHTHQCDFRADWGELGRLHGLNLGGYSAQQQAVLLRTWFASMDLRMPNRAALNELCQQLNHAKIDQHMCWRHQDGWAVARFRDDLIAAQLAPLGQWVLSDALQTWVREQGLVLKARSGGERVRLHPQRPSMSLKQAYQAAGVAPMLRAQLPLIYRGDTLVYVVGVGEVIA